MSKLTKKLITENLKTKESVLNLGNYELNVSTGNYRDFYNK